MPHFSQRQILAVLFVSTLAIFFWGLGSIPLLSFNEARRAVPVREMLASGDWLIPTLNAHLYISKPPLLYWLAGLPAMLFHSTSEWVVRLPSALAALAITWLVFFTLRRQFGMTVAAFAVLILITSAGFTAFARRSEIEMLLTVCCFGSVLAAYQYIFFRQDKRLLDAAFLCIGLALLTKGPVALLFYIPMLLVFWWKYRLPQTLDCLTHLRGWLIAIVVGGLWYLLVSLKLGWDVWHHVVETDIAGKVGEAKTDPLYEYPLWLLADFLPWILLVLMKPRENFRRWIASPQQGFFLLAALVPLVIFSLFSNKHAKYLLPSYPAWAALLALSAADTYARVSDRMRVGAVVLSGLLVVGFFTYYAAVESRVMKHRYEVFPEITAVWAARPNVPVYVWEDVDPRTVYYVGKPVAVLKPADLDASLRNPMGALLFVEEAVPVMVSTKMCLLAEFSPYLKRGHKASIWGSGKACSQAG
jgi:4-amino-4-deoxy-L-arabinose transferase-like glycosyltransferase